MNKKIISYTELKQNAASFSAIFYFGAGDTLSKTRTHLSPISHPEFLFDNNPSLWDVVSDETANLKCFNPVEISNHSSNPFLIITCSSYAEVASQLEPLGFEWGKNMFLSPYFSELEETSSLINAPLEVVFASGYPSNSFGTGGGLYYCSSTFNELSFYQLLSGQVQSVLRGNNNSFFTTSHIGLQNHNFCSEQKLISDSQVCFESPTNGSRLHGIAFDAVSGKIAISASHEDKIYILDEDYKLMDTISISNSLSSSQPSASHHVNDVLLIGDMLYYTCFSFSGLWKHGVYDGCLVVHDLISGYNYPVVTDLYMPHNIIKFKDSLWVCDSMRSELKSSNHVNLGKFPGFLRGLDECDNTLLVYGLSGNRNRSRALSCNSISFASAGIGLLDYDRSVSRLITFPQSIPGIHSIQILN